MAAPAYCFGALKLDMDEKPEEIIIRCRGRITAESAEMFERQVRESSIPASRGKGIPVINRIVLDLSNVTRIDNAGVKAMLDVWTAGQKKGCSVEIVNYGSRAMKRTAMLLLDQAFRRVLALF